MNDSEILESLDEIFQTHLDSDFWAGLEKSKKEACAKTATMDILARAPWMTEDDIGDYPVSLYAIAEQAVWLARNYSEQTGGKIVTSESVEGLSVGYTLVGGASKWGVGIAPRAEAYLDRLQKGRKAAGIRFTRG